MKTPKVSNKVGYTAGAYRGASNWEVAQNIEAARRVAQELWAAGIPCICPHSNTAFMDFGHDHVFLEGDIEIMRRCDFLVMVGDWRRSDGATRERYIADTLKLPVYFSAEEAIAAILAHPDMAIVEQEESGAWRHRDGPSRKD